MYKHVRAHHMYIETRACVCIEICVCQFMYEPTYLHACACMHACMRTCLHTHTYTYTCESIYIFIETYIHHTDARVHMYM